MGMAMDLQSLRTLRVQQLWRQGWNFAEMSAAAACPGVTKLIRYLGTVWKESCCQQRSALSTQQHIGAVWQPRRGGV